MAPSTLPVPITAKIRLAWVTVNRLPSTVQKRTTTIVASTPDQV